MGLFDGDYKMTAQSQREAEVSRGADEAYAAQGELHAPVTHTPDHGITPEVREEACEAAIGALRGPRMVLNDARSRQRQDAELSIDAAIPVIAGAAYKAGLEAEREKLTDFRVRLEDLTAGMSMDPRMPKEAISALRSFISEVAAIDKEGEERG